MMSNPSERCKQWEDFYYWNHTNDEDKHFFKVILGDCRHGMSMPDKFVRNFNGTISETIKLETRNGNICNVQVTKDSEKLVLGRGWEAFAIAHDLRSTDFVVFRYSGDSHFKVLLFDGSGCEKSSSCVSLNNMIMKLNNAKTRQEDPVHLPRSSGHDHPAQSPQKEGRLDRPRRDWLSCSNKKIIEVSSSPSSHSDATGDASSSEHDRSAAKDGWCVVGARRVRLSGCIFPGRTRLTRAQKEVVEEKVRAIGSELPVYGAVMTGSKASSRHLTFCREYARKWLPSKDQTVSLRRHGRSWDAQLEHTSRKRKISALHRGWTRFFRDNRIRAGDILLLEKTTTCVMNAHVIRSP